MMIAPLPDTVALWKDINAFVTRTTEFTERTVEVRTLLKRIEALKNADLGQAFLMLGSIYQLTGEIDEMRDAFRKAAYYVSEYSYSEGVVPCLMNTGFFSEAQTHAKIISDPTQGHFSKFVKYGLVTGIFRTLVEYIGLADKMHLEVSDELRDEIAKAYAIVEHFEVQEQVIGEMLDLVGEVFRSNRLIYFGEPELTIWGFDEHQDVEPHICFDFSIAKDATTVAELRSELASKIAGSKLGHFPLGLLVQISPADLDGAFALAA